MTTERGSTGGARAGEPAVRVLLLGWATVLLMAALGAVVRPDDRVAMAVFAVIAVLMGLWVSRSPGRGAVLTSLVLGVLHTLEQVAYTLSGVTDEDIDLGVVTVDVVGLVGGVLIVVGAVRALRALRARRRTGAET